MSNNVYRGQVPTLSLGEHVVTPVQNAQVQQTLEKLLTEETVLPIERGEAAQIAGRALLDRTYGEEAQQAVRALYYEQQPTLADQAHVAGNIVQPQTSRHLEELLLEHTPPYQNHLADTLAEEGRNRLIRIATIPDEDVLNQEMFTWAKEEVVSQVQVAERQENIIIEAAGGTELEDILLQPGSTPAAMAVGFFGGNTLKMRASMLEVIAHCRNNKEILGEKDANTVSD